MRNKVIEKMTISAILIAIIVMMSYIPYVGYITIPGTPISICTIHIVVILAALLFGWDQGLVAGLTFGLFSLIIAATSPKGPGDAYFVNPLVSVLPRVLFGVISGLIFTLLRKIKNIGVRSVAYVVGAVLCTAIHTTLVLFMLWLCNINDFGSEPFSLIVSTLIAINGLIEMGSAGIIVPTLALGIGKARKKYDAYAPVKTAEVKKQ